MINPFPIISMAKSSHKAIKKYRTKMSKDAFAPEIKKLRKEAEKWTASINQIGREYPKIGDAVYKIEENVINYLSVIERVSMPCARYNIFIPKREYFYTDPTRIKDIRISQENDLIEKIYPKPEKAVSSIESIIEKNLKKSRGCRYIKDFKERKTEVVEELAMLSREITAPYNPGTDYSSVQKALIQTVKKMEEIKSEYLANIHELEYQRSLHRLKIAATTAAALAVAVLLNCQFKKPRG